MDGAGRASSWCIVRRVLRIALGLALLLASPAARADDASILAGEVTTSQWWHVPLTLLGSDVSRRLAGLKSPASWAAGIGVGVDGELHFHDVIYHYGGVHFSSSLNGQDSAGVTGESPVAMGNGPLNVLEIDMLGIGGIGLDVPLTSSFKFGFTTTWGWAYAWSAATVTSQSGISNGTMHTDSIFWRAEADACVRLGVWAKPDSSTSLASWACLTAAPTIYEFDWLSGGSIGLKVLL